MASKLEKEIQKQIDWLEVSIKSEERVLNRFNNYDDSPIKSGVLYQTKGALRGLRAGVRSLEIVLENIKAQV